MKTADPAATGSASARTAAASFTGEFRAGGPFAIAAGRMRQAAAAFNRLTALAQQVFTDRLVTHRGAVRLRNRLGQWLP